MSAEPPPPDWVRNDTAFHHRRFILDGEETRRTRSSPRVILEPVPHAPILEEPLHYPADHRDRRPGVRHAVPATPGIGLVATVRQEWEDFAFTTLRRTWLIAFLGFVVVLALGAYGWQRGTLSGMAAEIAGERGVTPAAPRLSSDQVTWIETADGDDGGERRSTASFASDRAFADGSDDEPTSGAKLFVADGKKSSRSSTTDSDDGLTGGNAGDTSRRAATGSGSSDPLDPGAAPRKRAETTEPAIRYEDCAEAAAAGAAPIRLGEPGYRLSLDRDKDGVACENGSTPEDPGDAPVDSLYSSPTTTTPEISGVTTTSSGTGAGTTATADSTGTSTSSTVESSTTTMRSTTESSRATSTTVSTTTSTTISTTTSTTVSTVVTTPTTSISSTSSSTTASTRSSTTATTPTTVSTTTSSTTTASTTIDPIQGQSAVSSGRP